jgi:hypothetical protein
VLFKRLRNNPITVEDLSDNICKKDGSGRILFCAAKVISGGFRNPQVDQQVARLPVLRKPLKMSADMLPVLRPGVTTIMRDCTGFLTTRRK